VGRPLLYGVDGMTPILREADPVDKAAEHVQLLVVAFGALQGLLPGRFVRNEEEADNYRQAVAFKITEVIGAPVLEKYYGVQLTATKAPGPEGEERELD